MLGKNWGERMFDLTESMVMSRWGNCDLSKPMVSIRCAAYNHEKFIARALESFLSQETRFPYEIVVHDDASTDNTANIIREYETKFPHIIRPIYEKQNIYSKDKRLIGDIFSANTKGKYTALCEGDDYWCDSNKLQKQVDFMESHPECSLCTHNTNFHYLDGSKADHLFNLWKDVRKLSVVDIFFGWDVHTSSYMVRTGINYRPEFSDTFWSGDYVYLTMAKYYGEVYCLPDVMSVYNANVTTGMTVKNRKSSYEVNLKRLLSRIEYLDKYDEYTNHKYIDIIKARKAEIIIKTSDDYGELKKAAKEMSLNPYFSEICVKGKGKAALKNIWKYKGAVFGRLWYLSVIVQHKKEQKRRK